MREIRAFAARFGSDSKSVIKSSLKQIKLENTKYNVSDQYPSKMMDRRKQLIPLRPGNKVNGLSLVETSSTLIMNRILPNKGTEKSVIILVLYQGMLVGWINCKEDEDFLF